MLHVFILPLCQQVSTAAEDEGTLKSRSTFFLRTEELKCKLFNMTSKKKATRSITAATRDQIRQLVDVVAEFLPLSTYRGKGTSFQSIFAESGVADWPKDASKNQALQYAWENVIRYHSRLPYTLVRKIVPAAIAYRRHKRNPLTQAELDRLRKTLYQLGFDMRAEIGKIKLDEELPRITVPPEELVKRLEGHDLHEAVQGEPLELFRNGHFNEAVRKGAERFEDAVRERSNLVESGMPLMSLAFSPEKGPLRLVNVETENQEDFQRGYMFLAMGMMQAIRNVFSHGDEERRPPEECFETLLFLNWLFRHLELAERVDPAREG